MSNLLILRGIPASGKSTFAREWVAESPETRVRINRDDIRFQLFGKYWGVDEGAVTMMQDAMLRSALRKRDVVLDNTNLKARDVKSVLKIATETGAEVEFKDFLISLDEALLRDGAREARQQRAVGDEVILSFYNRYTPNGKLPPIPTLDDEVSTAFEPYVYTPGLPNCIIVDIDGTLADLSHRSPYARDEALYLKDGYYHHVFNIIEAYSIYREELRVFLMSGRYDEFRSVTEEWLDTRVLQDDLFMRATGDDRNDAIVKNELFEKHIAGKYNVDFILDDRDRVVKMWRAKGLKCLQVASGDF